MPVDVDYDEDEDDVEHDEEEEEELKQVDLVDAEQMFSDVADRLKDESHKDWRRRVLRAILTHAVTQVKSLEYIKTKTIEGLMEHHFGTSMGIDRRTLQIEIAQTLGEVKRANGLS
jgi:hypothetical protein